MKKFNFLFAVILLIITTVFLIILNKDTSQGVYYEDYILNTLENNDNDFSKAIEYVNNELENDDLTHNEIGLNLLARDTYYYMNLDSKNFIKNYNHTEKVLASNNMDLELVHLYSMVTSTYLSNFQFEKAYIYINDAERIVSRLYNKNNDEETLSTLLAIMYLKADLGMKLNLEIEATETFEEAEKLRESYNGRDRLDIYSNISKYYFSKQDYKNLEKYTLKTIDYLDDLSQKLKDENGETEMREIYKYDYALSKFMLAQSYLSQGKIDESIELLESSDEYNEYFREDLLAFKYYLYSEIYLSYSNFEKAIEYLELAYDVIDNLDFISYKISLVDNIIDLSLIKDTSNTDLNYWYEKLRTHYDELDKLSNNQYLLSKIIDSDVLSAEYEIELLNIKRVTLNILLTGVISILAISIVKSISLEKKSRYDGLTKIYNRNYFSNTYHNYMKKKLPHHLVIFDIDNFKSINDNFGHTFGDVVLSRIGNELIKVKSKDVNVFRYGGEEFIVLVQNHSDSEAFELAEKLRSNIEHLNWREGIKVTISLGISSYSKTSKNTLQHADDNLYRSKNTGKNKITFQ